MFSKAIFVSVCVLATAQAAPAPKQAPKKKDVTTVVVTKNEVIDPYRYDTSYAPTYQFKADPTGQKSVWEREIQEMVDVPQFVDSKTGGLLTEQRLSPHSGKSMDEIMIHSIQALHERYLRGQKLKFEERDSRSATMLQLRDLRELLKVVATKAGILATFSTSDLRQVGDVCLNTVAPIVHNLDRVEKIVAALPDDAELKPELTIAVEMTFALAKAELRGYCESGKKFKIAEVRTESGKTLKLRENVVNASATADALVTDIYRSFRNLATKY